MYFWLLSLFLGFMVWNISPPDIQSDTQIQDNSVSQRATLTVRYINDINDWRYKNSTQKDGVIPDSTLGWKSIAGLHHILQSDRIYVYQPNQNGLMAALLAESRQSSLIGKVTGHRLIDVNGNDMQVTIPPEIGDGNLVYLN
jgi:hypothetical protein